MEKKQIIEDCGTTRVGKPIIIDGDVFLNLRGSVYFDSLETMPTTEKEKYIVATTVYFLNTTKLSRGEIDSLVADCTKDRFK